MSSHQELHVNFRQSGTDYNINLVKGEKSEHSVQINGVSYAVLGEKEKLKEACKILKSVSLDSISNSEDLKGKLSLRKDISFPQTQKTTSIGTKTLGTKEEFHAWKQDEENNLPKMFQYLAKTYWNNRKNKSDHSKLREFLESIEAGRAAEFDRAMKAKDFKAFSALFKGLSADDLWNIRNNENCQPLGFVKTEPYKITEEDKINLKQYLDDIGFSGSVTLSDAEGTYGICPTNQESQENTPFSIHSIAKIFTGTLALMTMSPDDFKKRLNLAPSVLSYLEETKKPVYDHLKEPNLLQSMNHNGGFGDFLGNYEKAVADALKKGEDPPDIKKAEDFLKYAETTIYPLDKGIYSNLGILLVSLAVQHKSGDKPFDQLIQELIFTPAKISISASKPENGKFNADDPCRGMLMGGPSGGFWTTSKELLKLGTWLLDKCKTDPGFVSKMEKYGTEFYVADDKEIRHNGCSASGSSFLSSFRESGITISVLSDQSNFMANRIYYTIREKMIEKRD